jgi:hypothetical protein
MTSTLLLSGFAACGTGALFALLLAKPLYGTLGDACRTGRSAAFWTAYSTVMMILAPALGVLVMAAFPSQGLPVEVVFSRALLFGLACLIIALLAIGNVMGRTAFKQFDADLKAGLLSAKPERQ